VCSKKIQSYELDRNSKTISNSKTIFTYNQKSTPSITKVNHSGSKVSFLIDCKSTEIIIEFDLAKNTVSNSFENENVEEASILSLCYQNGKLVGFGSDCCLVNLTDSEEIVKISGK
jgi:hypothetical protein